MRRRPWSHRSGGQIGFLALNRTTLWKGTNRPASPPARWPGWARGATLALIAVAADTAWLTANPLDPLDVLARVATDPARPVMSMFVGTVRADTAIREVRALDYEAYAGMAEREMAGICREAAERFGVRCAMAHRTGTVAVGQPSVAAACAAAGDAAALDACEWIVDRLKERVPVWKLQRFVDGGATWSEGA